MKLSGLIFEINHHFLQNNQKEEANSPKPLGKPTSRAETAVRQAGLVKEGDVKMSEKRIIECFEWKWHDMDCDTSRSEGRQGGPGRPRRRCLGGRRGGREIIAPVTKTGRNRLVGLCDLQWFHRSWQWICRWDSKRYQLFSFKRRLHSMFVYVFSSHCEAWNKQVSNTTESIITDIVLCSYHEWKLELISDETKAVDESRSDHFECHWQIRCQLRWNHWRSHKPTRRFVPVFITGAMCSRPPRQPPNTVVMASQARLDGPQTDSCRRPCSASF